MGNLNDERGNKVQGLYCLLITMVFLVGCMNSATTKSVELMSMEGVITAIGYASISEQRGDSKEKRQLHAMRASKLNAYQELSEQVYGVRLNNHFMLSDQRLAQEQTSGNVSGIIRGAKVIRTYPLGDTYITEMELDLSTMEKLNQNMEVISIPNQTEWRF